MNKKILIITFVTAIVIIGWAPWLSNNDAKVIVKTYRNFQEQHSAEKQTENPEINVMWLPFCRWVTTYEGGWTVCFWQTVKK
ncbi:hypothetical protein HYW17_05975 [Candidatus Uhrbacteria bacterium]|nr:hypothetical protein [Candidatus Uhrbacteria bacterium]